MRIEKILVAMDFSPTSRLALQHALALARKCGGRLAVLHVAESSNTLTSSFSEETVDIQREHIEQARRMLDALVGAAEWNHVNLRTILKTGDIADSIISTAVGEEMDFLVMGTHGRGLFGRPVIGSVTHKVLHNLDIPVLTVRQLVRIPTFDRMLFATDLSESSRQGLRFVSEELAQAMESNVIALHAVDVGLEGGAEAAVYLGEQR